MRILVACEYSQSVTKAFRKRGHEAFSCDLLPTEGNPEWHIQGDVLTVLNFGWDLMIACPDCTYLTCSAEWAYTDGPYHQKVKPGTLTGADRRQARDEAVDFVLKLANAPIEQIAIENPVGVLSSRWREPDQYIQPNEYGEDASKETCLWLKKLEKLEPTGFYPPRLVLHPNGKRYVYRWGNQTDSGQNNLSPSDNRGLERARFYEGWSEAMAEQWGAL